MNPNAHSFTPYDLDAATEDAVAATGNAGFRDSFLEYAEMHDNIEAEMEEDVAFAANPPPAASGGSSQLPAHLESHKREFWFPDNRNCICCHGYRYACKCVDAGGVECACVSGGPVTASPDPSLQPAAAAVPPTSLSYSPGGGGRGGRGGGRGRGGRGGGRGCVPCKFFFSQGGCRFGDSCSFSHQQV